MKRFTALVLGALLLVSALPIAVVSVGGLSGCTTAKRQTFNTIYTIEVSTTATFTAFLSEVAKGRVATNSVPTVSTAFNVFQDSVRAAILFLGDTNAPAPPSLLRASSDVLVSIDRAKGIK